MRIYERDRLSSRRKLLRLFSFICGVFLLAFGVFLAFIYREFYFNIPVAEPGGPKGPYMYDVILGILLFIIGMVLVVASYYHPWRNTSDWQRMS
jgi:vacuolar-type H+-ATPase subunit I/STV1